jgi:hypothetical protein
MRCMLSPKENPNCDIGSQAGSQCNLDGIAKPDLEKNDELWRCSRSPFHELEFQLDSAANRRPRIPSGAAQASRYTTPVCASCGVSLPCVTQGRHPMWPRRFEVWEDGKAASPRIYASHIANSSLRRPPLPVQTEFRLPGSSEPTTDEITVLNHGQLATF